MAQHTIVYLASCAADMSSMMDVVQTIVTFRLRIHWHLMMLMQ